MSIKYFCDGCAREITPANCIGAGGRLVGSRKFYTAHSLEFEVMLGRDGVSNSGEWCKYCVIDAVKSYDDRPAHLP